MSFNPNHWPKDNQADLIAYYTRPNGTAKWEVTNLVYIPIPWTAYLAGTQIVLTHGLRVHKKVAESLKRVLADIWLTFKKSQVEIEKVRLHQIGGTYFYRPRRGSSNLSLHAFGAAIDLDPVHNKMTHGNRGSMDSRIVKCFQKEGWKWGYAFGDPMHFEATLDSSLVDPNVIPVPVPHPDPVPPVVIVGGTGDNDDPVTDPHLEIPIISEKSYELVEGFEDFRSKPYSDVGQLACGYGHTNRLGYPPVVSADSNWTRVYAKKVLRNDFAHIYSKIKDAIKVDLNPNQLGAVLSFAYNLGYANFLASTLLKKINASDWTGASKEFERWTRSKGKVLPGLVRRRKAEAELFVDKVF